MEEIVMADRAYHNPQRWTRPARVMILAMFNARNIIKQDLQAQGIKLSHVDPREVSEAASRYLAAHPELIAEAEETVRNCPRLRTLAALREQQAKGIQP
jgi:hypothetical protein